MLADGEKVAPSIPTKAFDGLFHPTKELPTLVGNGSTSGVPRLKLTVVGVSVPPSSA